MWQTDTITFQTVVGVNNYGGVTQTWSDTANTVLVDAQQINKELAFKNWGFTEDTEYRQIFDHTQNSNWEKGDQCKLDGEQWWQRKVDANMGKMGASNHTFIVLSKVVG